MKKALSIILLLCLCLGAFVSCNNEAPSESSSSEETVPVTVRRRQKDIQFELTEDEAKIVEGILNPENFPINDYCDCFKSYEFRFGNYRIRYDDGEAEDASVRRSKELSEEEATQINAIIEEYFGETFD